MRAIVSVTLSHFWHLISYSFTIMHVDVSVIMSAPLAAVSIVEASSHC